jgi:hypothetical protein
MDLIDPAEKTGNSEGTTEGLASDPQLQIQMMTVTVKQCRCDAVVKLRIAGT